MIANYNATVVKKETLAEHLVILTVKPDFPVSEFKAGQFAVLGLMAAEPCAPTAPNCKIPQADKLVKKAYSIASSAIRTDTLEFYIALVPEGELTPRLFNLKAGDRLFLGPKIAGKFTIDKIPADKHLLMIGTGTGLAPFLSMIRTDLVCGHTRRFVVLHGARHSFELGYFQELSLMAEHCENFHYIPALSRPDKDKNWYGRTGRVTDLLKNGVVEQETGLALSPDFFHALLCGNPDMIEDVSLFLESKGFRREDKSGGEIHTEEYW